MHQLDHRVLVSADDSSVVIEQGQGPVLLVIGRGFCQSGSAADRRVARARRSRCYGILGDQPTISTLR